MAGYLWWRHPSLQVEPESADSVAMPPAVAIACQGGGSHAAFAAGVLATLLGPEHRHHYRLVGLSGTSGGAMCAALAWAGLIRGGPDEARRRLLAFWRDLEVHDLLDAAVNAWSVRLAGLPVTGEVSPYLYEPIAEPQLRGLLRRHLDLDTLPADRRRRGRRPGDADARILDARRLGGDAEWRVPAPRAMTST
jgi:NTE family protein